MVIPLSILLLLHYNIDYIIKPSSLTVIDVAQGDAILINNSMNILIDTGGSFGYDYSKRIISYMMSLGIRKIDVLIITHGDYDHIGSSYQIVDNFPVSKVYFNNNSFNSNEIKLIDILHKKKIAYAKMENVCLNFRDGNLCSINSSFTDENDASIVLDGVINGRHLLLMGDASVKTENYLLKKYSITSIDYLKVGHHGSNTSSGKKFIEVLKPRVSLISVGINNLYRHPSDEVLSRLLESDVYLTSIDGSIFINFAKNGTIRTYQP